MIGIIIDEAFLRVMITGDVAQTLGECSGCLAQVIGIRKTRRYHQLLECCATEMSIVIATEDM